MKRQGGTGPVTRRMVLRGGLGFAALGTGIGPVAAAPPLPVTPSCGTEPPSTPRSTAGPFYTSGTPLKRDFRADAPGAAFTLAGFVLDDRCRPVEGAMVDLWHADARGRYDNSGFRLRGHQFTDARGRYVFETIEPASYAGRTSHFHVIVRPRAGSALTTQLFFPGVPGNESDFLFDRRLLMAVDSRPEGKLGRFDFVLGAG